MSVSLPVSTHSFFFTTFTTRSNTDYSLSTDNSTTTQIEIMTVESKSDETQLVDVSTVSLSEEPAIAALDSCAAKEEKVEEVKLENKRSEEEEREGEEKEAISEEKEQYPSLGSVLVQKSCSFREESNFLSDLKENEKRALLGLRVLVEEAILENKLLQSAKQGDDAEVKDAVAEITLWGVPLLPSRCSESTNVVLLKFLRARDFKVDDAFHMLQTTIRWRKEHNIDEVVDEEVRKYRLLFLFPFPFSPRTHAVMCVGFGRGRGGSYGVHGRS